MKKITRRQLAGKMVKGLGMVAGVVTGASIVSKLSAKNREPKYKLGARIIPTPPGRQDLVYVITAVVRRKDSIAYLAREEESMLRSEGIEYLFEERQFKLV